MTHHTYKERDYAFLSLKRLGYQVILQLTVHPVRWWPNRRYFQDI
jgi:hypothetical protein